MPVAIAQIEDGESGLSVRQKLNLLIAGAVTGDLGLVTPGDLEAIVDTEAPDRPTGLTATFSALPKPQLTISWNANLEDDFAYYDLQIKQDGGNWVSFPTSAQVKIVDALPSTGYSIRVRAIDRSGNPSIFLNYSLTTGKDTSPPATPSGFTVAGGFNVIWLKWNANTESDMARYEVYESDDTTPPTDTTVPTFTTVATQVSRDYDGAGEVVAKNFWLRAVDTSDNPSPWTSRTPGSTVKLQTIDMKSIIDKTSFIDGITAVEIVTSLPTTDNFAGRLAFLMTEKKLYRYDGTAWVAWVAATDITGTIVGSQIADATLTAAKFASVIKPIEVVSTLPTTGNTAGRTVFLSTDYKLYRYTGTEWVASIASTDITGALTDAQIASISAAKLTGQITTTQISDDAITTPKVAAGAITALQIAANTIVAANIAAGTITATELGANSVNATHLAAGSVTAAAIAANSITGGMIQAGVITGDKLAVNSITARELYVTDFTNLVPDFQFTNASCWAVDPGWTLYTNASSLWQPAENLWKFTYSGQSSGVFTVTGQTFSVDPGLEYFFSWKFGRTGTTVNFRISVLFYDSSGGALASYSPFGGNAPSGVTTSTGTFTPPTGAVSARLNFYINANAGVDGDMYVGAPAVRVRNNGNLIVDGAITANHLSAGSVTAAAIAANSITAGMIQTGIITGDKMAANSITARELIITNFDNLIADAFCTYPSSWSYVRSGTSFRVNPVIGYNSSGTDALFAAGTSGNLLISQPIKVDAGSSLEVSGVARMSTGGTTGAIRGYLNFLSAAGAQVGFRVLSTWGVSDTGHTLHTDTVTVPSTAITAQFVWDTAGTTPDTAFVVEYSSVRKRYDGNLIVDGAITASKVAASNVITLTAQIADAIITDAKISTLSAAKLIAGTALAGSITVSGSSLATIASNANDPAARINAAATTINPGKVLISGVTTLASWQRAGDSTKIDGGQISANTIAANSAVFGMRGLGIDGLEFEHNSPTANNVSWTSGTITYSDDTGTTVTKTVSAGSVAWGSGTIYIFYAQGATALSATTSAATANGSNNAILATYKGSTNLVANYGRTVIDGSNIKTGTITATQIAVGAITATQIAAGAITAAKIAAGAINATHIQAASIDSPSLALNAVTQDYNVTLSYTGAGTPTGGYITTQSLTVNNVAGNPIDIGLSGVLLVGPGSSNLVQGSIRILRGTTDMGVFQVTQQASNGNTNSYRILPALYQDTDAPSGSVTYNFQVNWLVISGSGGGGSTNFSGKMTARVYKR